MSTVPKKLAVLVCGQLSQPVQRKHGSVERLYREYFEQTAPKGAEFHLDMYDVVSKMEYPAESQIESYDGIIYTGSGTPACLNLPKIQTSIFTNPQVPRRAETISGLRNWLLILRG